jgi:hypothetical protein
MELKVINKTVLPDGVIRYRLLMPSGNFLSAGYILESLEGLCIYTTPQDDKNVMQIDVVPDMADEFINILAALETI